MINDRQEMAGMFELPAREDCVKFVEYHDLEDLIKKVYGIYETRPLHPSGYFNFNLPWLEQWDNDEMHEFSIKRERLDKWDLELLDAFMKDPYSTSNILWVLLADMCNHGHIEEGKYIINVSW